MYPDGRRSPSNGNVGTVPGVMRRRRGANQYRGRPNFSPVHHRTVTTDVALLIQTRSPAPMPCRQIWGGSCQTLIGAPTWSHDEHPTQQAAINVARGTKIPIPILSALAHHNDPDVRFLIASNRSAPPEVLEYLSNDIDLKVRAWTAANQHTPPSTLEKLARDGSAQVRAVVAINIKDPKALERLLSDPEPAVARAAAANRYLPGPALAMWQLVHGKTNAQWPRNHGRPKSSF